MPSLTLNGAPHAFEPPCTLAALVARLGLDTGKVAVERNQAIVSRSTYAVTFLEPGDRLEIVHFIGGG